MCQIEQQRDLTFHPCQASRRRLTVPAFLARNAAELLLPREVVEADAPRHPAEP